MIYLKYFKSHGIISKTFFKCNDLAHVTMNVMIVKYFLVTIQLTITIQLGLMIIGAHDTTNWGSSYNWGSWQLGLMIHYTIKITSNGYENKYIGSWIENTALFPNPSSETHAHSLIKRSHTANKH